MTCDLRHLGIFTVCALLNVACTHYVSSYTESNVRLGFANKPMVESQITINESPLLVLTSSGCKRDGGLVAPPVVLELVSPANVKVVVTDQIKLLKEGVALSPYRIQEQLGYVGGDRVEISFKAKCQVLDGAELQLGRVSVAGEIIDVPPVLYRYSERRVTKVNRLPEQWWK